MLELQLEGIIFEFEISKYCKSSVDDWNAKFCKVHTKVYTQGPGIDYETNAESLLCGEVDEMYNKLNELIQGHLTEATEISFVEPYFEFMLCPLEKDSFYVDWKFNLWNDGVLSANSIVICLGEEDVLRFRDYLEEIIKYK